MYAIRLPDGTFLEGRIDAAFEMNNQVFSTGNTDVLPGSYTFPIDVPLTPANRVALNHPGERANVDKYRRIQGAELWCHGEALFVGTLTITEAGPDRVRLSIVVDGMAPLRDVVLRDLDLGGDRQVGAIEETLDYAQQTAEEPENYDMIFFPVYDPDFDGTLPDVPANDYINFWDGPSQFWSLDSIAFIPYVRIDYLLREMFAQHCPSVRFSNAWQTVRELKRLVLLNNFDARHCVDNNPPTFEYIWDLRNHVGETKCADLLRELMKRFCLGLFTDIFSKSITLIALRDVVRAQARHDWTAHALADYTIFDDEPDTPRKFCDPQPNIATDLVDDEVDIPTYENFQVFQSDLGAELLTPGLYYIESTEMVYRVFFEVLSLIAEPVGPRRRCVVTADSPMLESALPTPLTFNFPSYGHFPWYQQTGSYWSQNNSTWERTINAFTPQLMFYRGFQEAEGPSIHERPYASSDVVRPDAAPGERARITSRAGAYEDHGLAEYSLRWAGEYGLYERWWKPWHHVLLYGRHTSMQFTLPVALLRAFRFQDKVHVAGIDYFVKQIRVGRALSDARVLVEASLVSAI